MEFEGQYLSYEEYVALGGALDITSFNLLEFEARRRIDLRTLNRLRNIDTSDIPQEVKICEFNLIDTILTAYNDEITRGKASETVGSYSVTYNNDIKQVIEGKDAELKDMIKTYLHGIIVNGEHILYLGVD